MCYAVRGVPTGRRVFLSDSLELTMILPPQIAVRWAGPELPDDAEQMLAPDERRRRDSFGSAKRRREFLLGRVAARQLLADQLDVEPGAVLLRVADDDAVEVAESALHLSIAHSGGRAVAAVAPFRVGVDLEELQPRDPSVVRFMLHPDDSIRYESWTLPPDERLIACWTVKEAVLKALRTGFRLSPKTLRLKEIDEEARVVSVFVERDEEEWTVAYERRGDCYWAVAYRA